MHFDQVVICTCTFVLLASWHELRCVGFGLVDKVTVPQHNSQVHTRVHTTCALQFIHGLCFPIRSRLQPKRKRRNITIVKVHGEFPKTKNHMSHNVAVHAKHIIWIPGSLERAPQLALALSFKVF